MSTAAPALVGPRPGASGRQTDAVVRQLAAGDAVAARSQVLVYLHPCTAIARPRGAHWRRWPGCAHPRCLTVSGASSRRRIASQAHLILGVGAEPSPMDDLEHPRDGTRRGRPRHVLPVELPRLGRAVPPPEHHAQRQACPYRDDGGQRGYADHGRSDEGNLEARSAPVLRPPPSRPFMRPGQSLVRVQVWKGESIMPRAMTFPPSVADSAVIIWALAVVATSE